MTCPVCGQSTATCIHAEAVTVPYPLRTLLEKCRAEIRCGVSCTYTSEQIVRLLEGEK